MSFKNCMVGLSGDQSPDRKQEHYKKSSVAENHGGHSQLPLTPGLWSYFYWTYLSRHLQPLGFHSDWIVYTLQNTHIGTQQHTGILGLFLGYGQNTCILLTDWVYLVLLCCFKVFYCEPVNTPILLTVFLFYVILLTRFNSHTEKSDPIPILVTQPAGLSVTMHCKEWSFNDLWWIIN